MFSEPTPEREFPTAAVSIAAVAVVILVALFVMFSHRKASLGNEYASNITLSGITVSAASNMAGGTTTYVDGHLTNNGPASVTGVTMQATFAGQNGAPAQVENDLAKAIRTKDPLDLEPMSQAPIAPGASADFRLIFEDVKDTWDQNTPQVKVVGATTK